ncbi:MAG: superoxide dismutase, Ni [Sneathiellales bacterium]|nr:superoxide dismutase, Ni [Sneathiellales bacterium]
MLHKIISVTERYTKLSSAKAHCDVPCKIYDPAPALIAALSVVRMMDIMTEVAENKEADLLTQSNSLTRCVLQKEEEAEKVKKEIRIIWGDYFKAPQFEAHPAAHDLAHKIMLKASACKQGIARADGEELVELVNQFAEIFWETKGIETARKTSPYPPSMAVVYPQL